MTRVERREFIVGTLSLLAAPLAAEAQQTGKVYRIGFLTSAIPRSDPIFVPFWEELRRLGYIERQNLIVESRMAEGKDDRLPALAAELVDLKVDLIVAPSTLAAKAAKGASRTIPIVLGVHDPVGDGLVASLARPGGNVTGVDFMNTDLAAKRLQFAQGGPAELQAGRGPHASEFQAGPPRVL